MNFVTMKSGSDTLAFDECSYDATESHCIMSVEAGS